jgi:peptide-methionine (S)-S-oxide reductase
MTLQKSEQQNIRIETATLAGGCFWCLEAVFKDVNGVIDAVPGYTGGNVVNPTYEQVCNSKTGHAEAVQVTYDPAKITFREILDIFFAVHDPTTPNRQGADIGTQYRSAIFYHNEAQKAAAEKLIAELTRARIWKDPIVTQISPWDAFYPAEDYHRDYFARNPEQAYCQVVIAPKLQKFRRKWAKSRK